MKKTLKISTLDIFIDFIQCGRVPHLQIFVKYTALT